MPTIGTFIQLLPKGFTTARYRSTDATVFAAIEGTRTHAGSASRPSSGARATFSWCRAGNGSPTRRMPTAVLFSFSDRPVQQKLDLFREDRGNA